MEARAVLKAPDGRVQWVHGHKVHCMLEGTLERARLLVNWREKAARGRSMVHSGSCLTLKLKQKQKRIHLQYSTVTLL